MLMVLYTKENGQMIKLMAMEFITVMQMVLDMRANGLKILDMVKV